MTYPVTTSPQLRAVLRGLRQSRALSQAQVGQLLGVNQKRAAKIEGAPGVTSFDQIARLIAALDGRLVIETRDAKLPGSAAPPTGKGTRKAGNPLARTDQGSW